ncbi:MAG: hypothetical protein DESF_00297 [Desulfovibrio sp.]
MGTSFNLTDAEKNFLSRQARMSIEAGLLGKTVATIPEPPESLRRAQAPLLRPLGAFVTITLHRALRGCIGNIVGREPLYKGVWHLASAAAFSDPRFSPLTLDEWRKAELDISVLGALDPCPDPEKIKVGVHGLVLQWQGHSGVFLPQVPVDQGWNRLEYLDNLCLKANLPSGSWKNAGVELFCFEAFVFPA